MPPKASKSKPKDRKKSPHTVLEESKVNTDAPSDEVLKNSIETGIFALIHFF